MKRCICMIAFLAVIGIALGAGIPATAQDGCGPEHAAFFVSSCSWSYNAAEQRFHVEATVTNDSEEWVNGPGISVRLYDRDGAELVWAWGEAEVRQLAPGESAPVSLSVQPKALPRQIRVTAEEGLGMT
ncbi:MAG: FxLYD domain-containing protein [Synergistales bacterium]|nr:FxLYD domain-containing protein [Synergistales bacterium]